MSETTNSSANTLSLLRTLRGGPLPLGLGLALRARPAKGDAPLLEQPKLSRERTPSV